MITWLETVPATFGVSFGPRPNAPNIDPGNSSPILVHITFAIQTALVFDHEKIE